MKVQSSTIEVSKFKPKTLTLTFETEEEIKAFQTLMGYDATIPTYLRIERKEAEQLTKLLRTQMQSIYSELSELMESSN